MWSPTRLNYQPNPLLCYINDLIIMTRTLGTGISIYADDAVIYCGNYDIFFARNRLEQALVEIDKWCKANYININVQKTKYCLYGSRSKLGKDHSTSLNFGIEKISKCHQYNYLGVTIDECLNLIRITIVFLRNTHINYTNLVSLENIWIRIHVFSSTSKLCYH